MSALFAFLDFNSFILCIDLGSETALAFAKNKRREIIKSRILASFGPILKLKEHWEKGFLFVVYKEVPHAEQAQKALESFEQRKAITEKIRKELLQEGQSLAYAPLPCFYVRWPTKDPHPVSLGIFPCVIVVVLILTV